MKGKFFVVLLGLVICLCVLSALARGEEQKSQLYYVLDVAVKPSKISAYEEVMKEYVALLAQHESPFPRYAYVWDDFHYHFITPLQDYRDYDRFPISNSEIQKKIGAEKMVEIAKRFVSAYDSTSRGFIRYRPDLTYFQENPRFKSEEANFMFWRFCHVLPGKESEFENICREWVELDKEVNRSDAYSTFVVEIGTEMPLYFWTVRGISAADFQKQQEIYGTKAGEKAGELWNRTLALIQKLEDKTGMYRPDLSYIPKEK
jgi:hypothetical protein